MNEFDFIMNKEQLTDQIGVSSENDESKVFFL